MNIYIVRHGQTDGNVNKIIAIALIIVICVIFLICFILLQEPKVAVLGYHSFATHEEIEAMNENDGFTMDIDYFEKQLKYLKDNNYKILSLQEFYDYKQGKIKIPRKSALITLDDGYKSNYDLAFPLLREYGMQAVVFVIGEKVTSQSDNYMSLDIIEKARNEYPNITFASHSYALHEQGAIENGIDNIRDDFNKMDEVVRTEYFAYPYGNYNADIIQVLEENDYKLAFGFGPGKQHRRVTKEDSNYIIPRLNISNDMPFWKFKLRLFL